MKNHNRFKTFVYYPDSDFVVKSVPKQYDPVESEHRILKLWEENRTFQKSVELRKECKPFVFLEGPPTANGLPGVHHVLARAFKDIVCRLKTMEGFLVERKGGWDTHGLPVEIEVEKELGLTSKQKIEEFGIKEFNERCKESVFRYEKEWRRMTERMGFWIDLDNPYITLHNDYIESIWWSLRVAWDKGLLYKGRKVTPVCPRCQTSLSSHEVAQGYKDIEEDSIYIKFKVKGEENLYFLAWTTTPWTLLSNVALALHPDHKYAIIEHNGERLILAEELIERVIDGEYEIVQRLDGADIEGKGYEPLFDFVKVDKRAYYAILADFVTLDEGTGIVHIAPAFGEDDYNVGREYELPMPQPVSLDGKFTDEVPPLKGMFVKDADEKIVQMLDEGNKLYKVERYTHSYPLCWRCDSPLLYYARESWFIKMSALMNELLENNEKIAWYPETLKHGRFGNFLEGVKDWALSRERYWGTPLPIWRCGNGHEHCIGSLKELRELAVENFENIDLHKPDIDELKLDCPKCSESMEREPYVIDAWYDSGSAFFAQWHYPFENEERFRKNFPVDFISEGVDQTRGWFYTLHAISTLAFNSHAYNTVLSLGLILDREGLKMSKSRMAVDPWTIFNSEGADALRWYFLSSNAPWIAKRFYQEAVQEVFGKFLLTLWNSFWFFSTYANLDGFDSKKHYLEFDKRRAFDRWLISRLHNTIKEVRENNEKFALHKSARAIENFIINDLSNWYVRRSKTRFWTEFMDEDKSSGYSTMYDVFLTISKLTAPFIPFMSETIYQSLCPDGAESVHLCDYPKADESLIDEELEKAMDVVRELTEAGRALRAKENIKLRHPLNRAIIIGEREKIRAFLNILREEINVKEIEFADNLDGFMMQRIKPNHSKIGPKFKGKARLIVDALNSLPTDEIIKQLEQKGIVYLKIPETVALEREDLIIETKEKPNFKIEKVGAYTLILDTKITPELRAEGFARELIRRIQEMRKEMDLNIEEFIGTTVSTDDEIIELLEPHKEFISTETRSKSLEFSADVKGEHVKDWDVDGVKIRIGIERVG